MDQQKTDYLTLSDEALAEAAWQHRREALHGNRRAFGLAHEFERELRRRAGALREGPSRPIPAPTQKPWWQRWSSAYALSSKPRQMQ